MMGILDVVDRLRGSDHVSPEDLPTMEPETKTVSTSTSVVACERCGVLSETDVEYRRNALGDEETVPTGECGACETTLAHAERVTSWGSNKTYAWDDDDE